MFLLEAECAQFILDSQELGSVCGADGFICVSRDGKYTLLSYSSSPYILRECFEFVSLHLCDTLFLVECQLLLLDYECFNLEGHLTRCIQTSLGLRSFVGMCVHLLHTLF